MDNLYEENVECDFEILKLIIAVASAVAGVIGGQTMMF